MEFPVAETLYSDAYTLRIFSGCFKEWTIRNPGSETPKTATEKPLY